jgi:hypothetical protein
MLPQSLVNLSKIAFLIEMGWGRGVSRCEPLSFLGREKKMPKERDQPISAVPLGRSDAKEIL